LYVNGDIWLHLQKAKTVTVTVTEALVLCPLLEDRGRITERQNETEMFQNAKIMKGDSTNHHTA